MRLERVSEHIWSLTVWVLIPVRVWLVRDPEGGVTLVDVGLPFMARGILRAVERLHAGPLQRILLTHGHSDHVGALRRIVTQTPVPVYAHAIQIPYLEGALPYPRRRAAPSLGPQGGSSRPWKRALTAASAGWRASKPYLTPGHAPGHVVYYHEQDQVLIGGNLAMSKKGQVRPPMAIFTGDMEEAIRSLQILPRAGDPAPGALPRRSGGAPRRADGGPSSGPEA